MPFVMSAQVTGPEKVPVNMTPVGAPLEPLPVIVNVPPAANVPPIANEPLVSKPVVKLTLPKSEPVILVPDGIPVIAIKFDPLSDSVAGPTAFEAARVPPTLA